MPWPNAQLDQPAHPGQRPFSARLRHHGKDPPLDQHVPRLGKRPHNLHVQRRASVRDRLLHVRRRDSLLRRLVVNLGRVGLPRGLLRVATNGSLPAISRIGAVEPNSGSDRARALRGASANVYHHNAAQLSWTAFNGPDHADHRDARHGAPVEEGNLPLREQGNDAAGSDKSAYD